MNLVGEIKTRKIRKWAAIHITTALTIIGLVNMLSSRYGFAGVIFDTVLFIVSIGLLNTIIIAWFHGKEGRQKLTFTESGLHLSVIIIAGIIYYFSIYTPPSVYITPDKNSIAVLPFKNLSDSKDDEYFSDGVTEDILSHLSKIGGLKVISRTSSMKYKNAAKTISEIGKELGVETVLEGTVRRSGNRIRIVTKLINASSDEQIWVKSYDRELKDIFAIQTEVSSRIAEALKTQLSERERERIEFKATSSIDAYAYYLKGRDNYNQYKKDENEAAIDLFNKAVGLDPEFALAYAGLADAYAQRASVFGFDESWLDSSISMSLKAIDLEPDLAEAYKSLGVVYVFRNHLEKAAEQYQKAVELNPNYAPAVCNLASMYWWRGEYDKAYILALKGTQLDPARASAYGILGLVFTGLLEDSLAEKYLKTAIELHGTSSIRRTDLIKLYLMQGDFNKAKVFINKSIQDFPDDALMYSTAGEIELFAGNAAAALNYFNKAFKIDSTYKTDQVYILYQTGSKKEAEKIFSEMIEVNKKIINSGSDEFNTPYDLARIYSVLGKKDEALYWLQKAVDNGWRLYRYSNNDPLFKPVKNETGFKEIMKNLELSVESMRRKIGEREKDLSL